MNLYETEAAQCVVLNSYYQDDRVIDDMVKSRQNIRGKGANIDAGTQYLRICGVQGEILRCISTRNFHIRLHSFSSSTLRVVSKSEIRDA
jgi:hypothetical protein